MAKNQTSWLAAVVALVVIFIQTLRLKLLERRAAKLYSERVKVGIELDKLKREAEIEPIRQKSEKLRRRIEARRRRLDELQKRLDQLSGKSESLKHSISSARAATGR